MQAVSKVFAGVLLFLAAFAAQGRTPLVIVKNIDCLPGASSAVVLQEIYRRAAIPIEVVTRPAARATQEAMDGRADGEATRVGSYSDSHPYLIRIEPAYSRLRVSAFYRATSPKTIVSTADLMRHKLTIVRGIQASEELVKNAPGVDRLDSSRQLVKMLDAGRIEVAVDIAEEFKRLQNRLGITGIVEVPLVEHKLYHYLHSKHSALVKPLERIITEMKRTGELEKLLVKATASVASSCPTD